ncbi:MAG: hypothetical protein Q7S21_06990 [archaeon]|nr:hypothetical protein [archaeon]
MNAEWKILSTFETIGKKFAIIEINGLRFVSWLSERRKVWLVSPFIVIGKFYAPWIAKRVPNIPIVPAKIAIEINKQNFPKKDVIEFGKFDLLRGDGTVLIKDYQGLKSLGHYGGENKQAEIYDFYKKFNEIKKTILSIRERAMARKNTQIMKARYHRNKSFKDKLKVKKRPQRRI